MLWPVFDDVSFLLADRFYERHFGQGTDGARSMGPAAALRDAQRWLREVTFRELRERFPVVEHNGRACLLIGAEIAQRGMRGSTGQDAPGAKSISGVLPYHSGRTTSNHSTNPTNGPPAHLPGRKEGISRRTTRMGLCSHLGRVQPRVAFTRVCAFPGDPEPGGSVTSLCTRVSSLYCAYTHCRSPFEKDTFSPH